MGFVTHPGFCPWTALGISLPTSPLDNSRIRPHAIYRKQIHRPSRAGPCRCRISGTRSATGHQLVVAQQRAIAPRQRQQPGHRSRCQYPPKNRRPAAAGHSQQGASVKCRKFPTVYQRRWEFYRPPTDRPYPHLAQKMPTPIEKPILHSSLGKFGTRLYLGI